MTLTKKRPESGPSGGAVWKIFLSVATGVMTIGFVALCAWVWNTSESVTKLTIAVEANTAANKDVSGRLDRIADVTANHGASLSNIQTLQTAQGTALGERLRALEWRDRFPQQQGRR